MKHRIGFNRLSRKASHRKAMLRNMVTSLFKYEKITTTKAKALEVRRIAEKMINRAKTDSVHNRRIIARYIWDKAIINKLFTEIGPKHLNRNGGYTRILKIGLRQGDAADMVLLAIIGEESDGDDTTAKSSKKKEKKPKKVKQKESALAETTEKASEPKGEAEEQLAVSDTSGDESQKTE